MNTRKTNLLLSMLEQANDEKQHSMAEIVQELSENFEKSDEYIFRKLKQNGYDPNGRLAKNLTNRLYEYVSANDSSVVDTIESACIGQKRAPISDEELYEYLS